MLSICRHSGEQQDDLQGVSAPRRTPFHRQRAITSYQLASAECAAMRARAADVVAGARGAFGSCSCKQLQGRLHTAQAALALLMVHKLLQTAASCK